MRELTRETTDRTSLQDGRQFAQTANLSRYAQDSFQPLTWGAQSQEPQGGYLDFGKGGLYPGDNYTGRTASATRLAAVSETNDKSVESQIQKVQASEGAVKAAQFADATKQKTSGAATESYRTSIRESGTFIGLSDDQIAQLKTSGYQKFELYDPQKPGNGTAQDTGTVIDYKPQTTERNKSFALGMDYEEGRDVRTTSEKLQDFLGAAAKNASNPENYKQYIQGEIDKLIGVGEGMNMAKEETKASAAAGWQALTDGTAAQFLSKPNAINEPLFTTVRSALDAMSKDPQALNKATVNAVEALGKAIIQGNDYYNKLPDREKGHVIGQAAFAFVNPEGSTKSGEAAMKMVDTVATHVDAAVMKTVDQSLEAMQKAPELAGDIKKGLYEFLKGKELTGPELEAAGIPRGFFNDIEQTTGKGDNFFAMSKADEPADGMPRRAEAGSEKEPVQEKFQPTEHFQAELTQAIDRLSEGEKANLKLYDFEVVPVLRLPDVVPGTERLGACYSPEHKAIFVPQEIMRRGQWVANDDVEFALSHEIGHFFNAKANLEQYMSDVKPFRTLFQKDLQNIPENVLDSLQLSKDSVAARDEVLADLYAHSKQLHSNNAYSQLIKQWFPNALKVVEEMPKW